MKFYIAGKITGLPNFEEKFEDATKTLEAEGHIVMNPALLSKGFEHDDYMHICYAMIDVCDAVYLLDNWKDSKGANLEHDYAKRNGKFIQFQMVKQPVN